MILKLTRRRFTNKSTIGSLVVLDMEFDSLEDPVNKIKVYGNTCIPPGQYVLKLRTEGGKHAKYLERFGPEFHKGMLWLQDVPNFEYVYIHIGNTPDDTLGCILIGSTSGNDFIGNSEQAYREFYPKVAAAIESGDDVLIDIVQP